MNFTEGPMAEAYGSEGGYNMGYPAGVTIIDMVPDHIKHMVHPHWANYPPVNPMWHYLLGMVYVILGFFSFTGNGLVMYLFFNHANLRTPANKLIFNLTFSDFCMMLSQFPWFAYNCFNGGVWSFSPFACELYACLGSITGLCSLWTLAFISFDRYNVIVNGMQATPLSNKGAMARLGFCWGYATMMAVPPFFGWGKYIPEGILDSCSFDYLTRDDIMIRTHGMALIVFNFCIPVTIIAGAYVMIVKAVTAHESAMRAQAAKMNVKDLRGNADANKMSAEVRIAKVAICNVTLWLICWTPYAKIVAQGVFFDQSSITPIASMLPALIAKSASGYNPVVYAINHPRFRLAMTKSFPGFCVHENEPDNASTATEANTTQEEKA
uniref:Opsin 5 n=1 Tax=Euphausia superba TaxID=6819 RepID=A0A142BLT0_EUPSU|nr:opsin 5 [Euphausia superba]